MSKLTNKPIGSTYKERLLRHIAREELAKRWLQYLVEGLHILLLWSIGLFMTGLLYQIFNLSGSFERSSPRILAAGVVGVVLSSGILVVVLAATTHALVYEASPFGGPFSKVLFKLTSVMSVLFKRLMDVLDEMAYRVDQPCGRIRFYRILPVVGKVVAWPLWFCSMLVDSWRIELDEDDREKLIGAFMELTAEASDPKLLERAVGSFSYVEWSATGGESQESEDQLKKTWNRLSSTDTSVRVHETLREWVLPFVKYCVEHNKKIGEDIMDSIFRTYPMPTRFPAEVLFASFYTRNPDLRHLAALPSEECIAGVLCSYNLEGRLQGWQDVFNLAQAYCEYLLIMRKGDDVTRILSHVDRLDLIKSYIRYPGYIDFSLVEFTVEGHKHEILSTINQFIKTVDQSRLSPRSFADVFIILADPPPSDIDLSPIIDYLSQHPHNYTWERTSETVIAYLNSFGVSKITYHAALRRFLQQCLDLELRHPFERGMIRASDETRDRARVLLSGQSLPPESNNTNLAQEPSLSFPES
ncbi:hypothetical protein SISSUDRAFT_358304 [Sistotremastrum suecicum HHB10207 ss-3]|uniref:DUF6535 domain-containing protein n=1 Tax=Sistotremastrum suecicum HHB10207 ss-3 TaxID=1314776 RepID=A0A165Z791_9AGAM|nr:hypothetical protein SISSUDRAFT_358304 [Sistotremastrum suecicum HHB10207 ss-3]